MILIDEKVLSCFPTATSPPQLPQHNFPNTTFPITISPTATSPTDNFIHCQLPKQVSQQKFLQAVKLKISLTLKNLSLKFRMNQKKIRFLNLAAALFYL